MVAQRWWPIIRAGEFTGCKGLISHEMGLIICAGCPFTHAEAWWQLQGVSIVSKVQTAKPLVPPRRFYPMSQLPSQKVTDYNMNEMNLLTRHIDNQMPETDLSQS